MSTRETVSRHRHVNVMVLLEVRWETVQLFQKTGRTLTVLMQTKRVYFTFWYLQYKSINFHLERPSFPHMVRRSENAIYSPILNLSDVRCTHEVADMRILFHVIHAIESDLSKVIIHATDTDVSSTLDNCQLWWLFVMVQNGVNSLSPYCISVRCWIIMFLHAVSACDTVSAFHGVGKKTAWFIWCA